MLGARSQPLTTCLPLALAMEHLLVEAHLVSERVHVRVTMFCQPGGSPLSPEWRDVFPCNDNVPVIIVPGRVLSKGRSACLGIVPLSNNVVGTDMLLKPLRKEWSACPGVQQQHERDRRATESSWLIDYNQWDHSHFPKMLSVLLVCTCIWICTIALGNTQYTNLKWTNSWEVGFLNLHLWPEVAFQIWKLPWVRFPTPLLISVGVVPKWKILWCAFFSPYWIYIASLIMVCPVHDFCTLPIQLVSLSPCVLCYGQLTSSCCCLVFT